MKVRLRYQRDLYREKAMFLLDMIDPRGAEIQREQIAAATAAAALHQAKERAL